MKALILFCLLACGLEAAGQRIPAKANTVLVQTPDSANQALRKLATVFVAQGYTVEKLDKEFHTLTLAPKIAAHKYTPLLYINANATDAANSVVRISGEYKATIMRTPVQDKVFYSGHEESCVGVCFRELQKAALSYPSGKVTYAKQ